MSNVETSGAIEKVALPANAYRPLPKGEHYQPPVGPEVRIPEATFRSVAESSPGRNHDVA